VIVLIDEIHTPDSSRYSEGYQERQDKGERRAKQLSKSFSSLVDSKWFQGLEGQSIPDMSDEYIETVSERYIELYEKILGEKFVRADISNINEGKKKRFGLFRE
jgi:phosphoribosylaminoimidazole-succinocarboxamide synthase